MYLFFLIYTFTKKETLQFKTFILATAGTSNSCLAKKVFSDNQISIQKRERGCGIKKKEHKKDKTKKPQIDR